MNNFKYILFDLDGTLIDSGKGIINGVEYALKKMGIAENNSDVLKSFIGPPLKQRFTECYGFSPKDCDKVVAYFREYYVPKGIFENKVYPEIPMVLQRLKKLHKHIMVATSKPEHLAYKILGQNNLVDYFDFIGGSLMDETRTTKAEVLQYVLESNNLSSENISDIVMIGDTKYDIVGAKKFNIATIGVTYGYGSRDELVAAKADSIVDSPMAILDKI